MPPKSVRIAGIAVAPRAALRLCPPSCDEVVNRGIGVRGEMGKARKVTCEDCYFGRNMLCALALDEPCATFRPDHPDGLRPPSQLRFVFRQERLRQQAWAFPTAQEQATLHA